jgi:ABC-2 type transport system permease protein
MMWVALRVELAKAFSKWRTYIAFIAIGILIPIVVFSMKAEGEQYFSFATQAIQQVFTFSGNLMNGYTVAYILMGSLYVHMPFLVTLVAGDILAGEATGGTYRLLLTRPLSRTMMVSSKFITTVIATNALVLFMALLSIGLGVVTMGTGEVVVIQSKITILAADDVPWRFVLAYGYAALAMTTVSSIAFLFSSLVENAIGPIMTTMALIIVFTILSAIDLLFFDSIRPLLFTTHMQGWKYFFSDPVDWDRLLPSISVLLGHIAACYAAALFIMKRKDILT